MPFKPTKQPHGESRSRDREYDPSGGISRAAYILQAMLEYFVVIVTTESFLTNLLNALEFSTAAQGMISSVASLMFVAELFSVLMIRKRSGIKRTVVWMTLLNQFFFALLYFTPFFPVGKELRSLLFLVFIGLAYLFFYLPMPFKTAWLMSNVQNSKRGSFTAKNEIVSLIGGLIFTFLMGRVIDNAQESGDPQRGFFICGVTLLGLTVMNVVSLLLAKERKLEEPCEKEEHRRSNFKYFWNTTMKSKQLRRVMLIHSVFSIALAANNFNGPYQRNVLGFSMSFISLLALLYAVFRSLVSPVFGRYADRRGWAAMLMPCYLIAAVAYFVNAFSVPAVGHVTYSVFYCLYAVSMGGLNSGKMNLTFEYVDMESRVDAFAWQTAIGGVVGFVASFGMSLIVQAVEKNGNQLCGMTVYPQQLLYIISSVLFVVLFFLTRALKKETA